MASSCSSCLSILRLGYPEGQSQHETAAQSLRSAIFDHLKNHQQQAQQQQEEQQPCLLTLANRYFSAQVSLCPMGHSAQQEQEANGDANNNNNNQWGLPWKEDGVILVVCEEDIKETTTTSLSLESLLEPIHQQAIDLDRAGDLLRMVVVVTKQMTNDSSITSSSTENDDQNDNGGEEDDDPDFSNRVLWCLDRGYEYVGRVDLSHRGIRSGHDERDKSGFARVMEAICGTVWSSAVMAPRTKQALQNDYHNEKEKLLTTATTSSNAADSAVPVNPYIPPTIPPLQPSPLSKEEQAAEEEREKKAREALLEQSGILPAPPSNDAGTAYGDNNNDNNTSTVNENAVQRENNNSNGDDDERYFDQLEGALRQARRIRDLSQSGQLSDEDRRHRAGEAAVLLYSIMGNMEGDDDDDESSKANEDEKEKEGGETADSNP